MSVLDRATAHFESKEVKRIEVPEWGDENGTPAVLMFEPFTINEQKTLRKIAKDDETEFVVRLVIMKVMDESGNKVFDLSDKPTLMNKVDPNIIIRIAGAITAAESVEDMVGN
jgi:hypothetical protein